MLRFWWLPTDGFTHLYSIDSPGLVGELWALDHDFRNVDIVTVDFRNGTLGVTLFFTVQISSANAAGGNGIRPPAPPTRLDYFRKLHGWQDFCWRAAENLDSADWTRRYPLVNIQKSRGNHHKLMGKSTISMAIFNSFLYVYQRVESWLLVQSQLGGLGEASTDHVWFGSESENGHP